MSQDSTSGVPAEARSAADLVGADPSDWLFFWGHQPDPQGRITQSCLSQWWPATFEVEGTTFASAEHYMMWRKALMFRDNETAERVLAAATPKDAKALGREVRDFDDTQWTAERWDVVVTGSVAKFGADDALREYLLGTGSRVLVEASPVDRIWGIGLAVDAPAARDAERWRGLNLLGFALMEARSRLG